MSHGRLELNNECPKSLRGKGVVGCAGSYICNPGYIYKLSRDQEVHEVPIVCQNEAGAKYGKWKMSKGNGNYDTLKSCIPGRVCSCFGQILSTETIFFCSYQAV